MELHIKNYRPHQIIKECAKLFKTTATRDCLETSFQIPEKFGKGKISGFQFGDGIGLILMNGNLTKDLKISLKSGEPPLQFNFNVSGNLRHFLDEDNIQYQLNPLRGSIAVATASSPQSFYFQGKTPLLFASLFIVRSKYREKVDCLIEKMPEKLASIFTDVFAEKPFFYHSNYSISIAECINKIANDKNTSIVRSTFIEGKALELLAMQVRQFQDDLLMPGRQVMLRRMDIDKIKKARDILIENLRENITIAQLAKKSGINQQKLKTGFKQVFEKTINAYLREERMERAAMLLLNDHSVREVVQAVGYSNQSHFARRFKEKYGILPRQYKQSIQSKIIDYQQISDN